MYVDEELDKIKVAPKDKKQVKANILECRENQISMERTPRNSYFNQNQKNRQRAVPFQCLEKLLSLRYKQSHRLCSRKRSFLGLDRLLRVKKVLEYLLKLILPTDNPELVKSLMYPVERDYKKAKFP